METLQLFIKRFGFSFDAIKGVMVLVLIYARIIPVVVMSPFLGGRLVTGRIKIILSLLLAILILPYFYARVSNLPTNLEFVFFLGKEFFVGFVIGFYVSVIFFAIQGAGFMIDLARGQTQGILYEPFLQGQVSVFGTYLNLFAIVVFFLVKGHILFIQALYESFFILPIDRFLAVQGALPAPLIDVLRLSAQFFVIALKLAVPVLLTILSVDILMGIINRIAPAINVFFLSFPLKGFVGVLMFLIAFPLIYDEVQQVLLRMIRFILHMVRLLYG